MNSTKAAVLQLHPQISVEHGPLGSNAIFAGESLEDGWCFEPFEVSQQAGTSRRSAAQMEEKASPKALHASVWGKSFLGEIFVPKAAARKLGS